MLIGKICCIKIHDYSLDWFKERYSSNSHPCRMVLPKIRDYKIFVDALGAPKTGLLARVSSKIEVLIPTLI